MTPADNGRPLPLGRSVNHWRRIGTSCYLARQHLGGSRACCWGEVQCEHRGRLRMSDGKETFDFIVSGAGSAGAVVAARLAESGRYRVLLLEAGPPDTNAWIHIPLGFAKTYVDARVNWKFESAPQGQFNNRRIYVPRGKTLGGTSSINGMVYMRGHPQDYTSGVNGAALAGTGTVCCLSSRRRRTNSEARAHCTVSAVRSMCRIQYRVRHWQMR